MPRRNEGCEAGPRDGCGPPGRGSGRSASAAQLLRHRRSRCAPRAPAARPCAGAAAADVTSGTAPPLARGGGGGRPRPSAPPWGGVATAAPPQRHARRPLPAAGRGGAGRGGGRRALPMRRAPRACPGPGPVSVVTERQRAARQPRDPARRSAGALGRARGAAGPSGRAVRAAGRAA